MDNKKNQDVSLELALDRLMSQGLVDYLVDEQGEFHYYLSAEGKKMVDKIKKELRQ